MLTMTQPKLSHQHSVRKLDSFIACCSYLGQGQGNGPERCPGTEPGRGLETTEGAREGTRDYGGHKGGDLGPSRAQER